MHRNTTLIVALILIVSMPALDIALVVMILPTSSQEFTTEPYGLIVSSYLVALLATTLLWGALSDRLGPRTPLLIGTALFLVGAVGASLTEGFWMLIVCRIVQGAGAGSMQALTQAAVAAQFSSHASRARVLAALSAAWGGAAVLAPFIVGTFPTGQWRLVFLATVPFGVLSLVLLPGAYRPESPRPLRSFDRTGMLLLLTSSACLGIVVTEPALPILIAALVLLTVSGGLLFLVERRAEEPTLPMELLRHRPFIFALLASVLLGAMLITTNIAAPLYGQVVLQVSPAVSGWVYAALAVAWTLSALAASTIVRRFGIRFSGVLGASTACLGYLLFLLLVLLRAEIGWLILAGFIVGMGLGPLANAVVIMCQEIASAANVGIASSLSMVTRTAGQSLGVALLTAMVSIVGLTQGVGVRQAALDPAVVQQGVALSLLISAGMAVAALVLISAKPNSRVVNDPTGL